MCDNSSFDGPNSAVECAGEWTNWEEKRFTGDTCLQSLQAAVIEKKDYETKQKKELNEKKEKQKS